MIEIQEIPKRFCRGTIYMLLSLRPTTLDELKSAFQSNFHAQLEQILLDGLHEGVFSLMYGGCKDGFWSLNKTCSDQRALRFIDSHTPVLLFPEKIRRRSLYGNRTENTNTIKLPKPAPIKKQKLKKAKTSARPKTKNIQRSKKFTRSQRRDWNGKIAIDFEKELRRLRKIRFDNGLDGVDRGALK